MLIYCNAWDKHFDIVVTSKSSQKVLLSGLWEDPGF